MLGRYWLICLAGPLLQQLLDFPFALKQSHLRSFAV